MPLRAHAARQGLPRSRGLIFAALCLVCTAVAVGYVVLALHRATPTVARSAAQARSDAEAIAALAGQPHLIFVDSDNGGTAFSRIAVAPLGALDASDRPRYLTDLECQRVYFAAGAGLCLRRSNTAGLLAGYSAFTFDAHFQVRQTFEQGGLPSRVRVSPDGRFGATTVFVAGHSYAEGGFSTQTAIVDMAAGTPLADLEQLTVWRDGARFQAADFNFWGVTFARDGNRFYATLGTGGKTYLVEGDLAAREARVLREGVECPSLSPDNARLVFKKRTGSGSTVSWRLYLLDLKTLAETPLAETRNVDDQVEWLDNSHILYALPDEGPPATIATNIWLLPIDGSAPPRLFLRHALSPVVVR